MTLETNQDESEPPMSTNLNPKMVHDLFIAAVLTILLDRAITLLFWSYESNVLVSSIGKESWIAITAVLIGALWIAWYYCEAHREKWGVYCMIGIILFHLLTVVTNLAAVGNTTSLFS